MPAASGSPHSSRSSDDDSNTPEAGGMYDPITQNDDTFAASPSSPASVTTDNDDPSLSANDQIIQVFRAQQRRPGLGVVHEIMAAKNRDGPPPAAEAATLLGYDQERNLTAELVAGDSVMLLNADFYALLIEWLGNEDDAVLSRMGEVDNRPLFEYYESVQRPGRMRMGLRMNVDYVLVTPKTWDLLIDWFGGGPGITRKCFNDNGRAMIDVRGVEVKVKRSSRPTKFMRHVFSIYDTVGAMKRRVIEDWQESLDGFVLGEYRIWDYANERCVCRMHPESAQLSVFRLSDGQAVMFEEADPITREFKWDPELGEEVATSGPSYYSSNLYQDSTRRRGGRAENSLVGYRKPLVRGTVGLSNLGNTCFMNSTLQCLSNIWLLRDRFVTDQYREDINDRNVLGTGGKLANSFGDLMKLIWGNESDVVSPAGFKSVMAEFKPEFSGYQQHDSQELLSFLLDGLHEDLNRVKVKPPTDPVEANGRADEEVAEDSRRVYHLRNDSFVNDLFGGFYKSTVVCPDCNKVSVTFDPFTMVQLPVSRPRLTKSVAFTVAVVDRESGIPFTSKPCVVRISQEGYMHEVKIKACASEKPGANPDDFILCSVYREKIEKLYSDFDRPERLAAPDELIAFEDANAARLKMISEVYSNGSWYRPLIKDESTTVDDSDDDFVKDFEVEPKSPSSLPSVKNGPFEEGDIWIGFLESKKYRARMQVKRVSSVGPWAKTFGTRVKCILDVAPNSTFSNSYYERRDGLEEVAYEITTIIPFVATQGVVSFSFEQGTFLGSFGSYVGDLPSLAPNRPPFLLVGQYDGHNFIFGTVEEADNPPGKRPSSMSSSMYAVSSKAFSMIKVDPALKAYEYLEEFAALNDTTEIGPKKEPSTSMFAACVVQHRRLGRLLGQPLVFTIPSNSKPKDLYEVIFRKMDSRVRTRLMTKQQLETTEGEAEEDKYGLKGSFRLMRRIPGDQPRILDEDDDETFVAMGDVPVPKLDLVVEWDSTRSPEEESRVGEALFGSLFVDDGAEDESKRTMRLYDCFDLFSEEEKLTSTETWYCSNCKAHKEAFKKMELWRLPPVLLIHFKRFSQSQSSYFVDKDDTEINFPLEGLDLRDRVRSVIGRDDCIYDLVSVSHHYGGLGGGHYVAHARNELNGNWYEFDDSSVRLLGESCEDAATRVKGGSAYVLMYVRRDFTAAKWNGKKELNGSDDHVMTDRSQMDGTNSSEPYDDYSSYANVSDMGVV